MGVYAKAIETLIQEFSKLPGIGPKSAERIAFHLLKVPPERVRALADALQQLRTKLRRCERCLNLAHEPLCDICQDPARDATTLCVVEDPADIAAIERTGCFRGVYHCLMGALSPLDGIGPDQIRVKELVARVRKEKPREVIVATDCDNEGEATALYIAEQLEDSGVRLARIAHGLPVGSELEYADQVTLSKAMEGRQTLTR